MPRFAANLSFLFTEHPFLDRFAAARAAGFAGVEFLFPYDFAPEAIAERLKASDLTLALFNTPPGDWTKGERGVAVIPGREPEFRSEFQRALDYAQALGSAQIHVLAGIAPQTVAPARLFDCFVGNLRHAANAAASRGVRALIEPINNKLDIPGYYLNTAAQAREVMAAVDHQNLFLQCDLYHAQIMTGRLTETIDENFSVIRHIQIAGVPGRHEPDQGEINYPFLFDHLDHKGYDGWIGCEYRPAGRTEDGLGWARAYGIGRG